MEVIIRKLEKLSNYYKWFGVRGLFFTVINKFLHKARQVKVSIPGSKYPVILRLKTSDLDTYGKIFGEEEYRLEVCKKPKVILDAGANIGLSAVYFANQFPQATIIAVEPEQSNFSLLRANTASYPNIIPIRAALWNKNELISLIAPPRSKEWEKWGFQTQSLEEKNTKEICDKIPAITVEKIMRDYQIEFVDILKIDVEGAEKEVFENSFLWIDKIGIIVIELHEHLKPGCNRSFYNATNNFQVEWAQGENFVVAKEQKCFLRSGII
jgi:FkbM family methyltransferase